MTGGVCVGGRMTRGVCGGEECINLMMEDLLLLDLVKL